MAYVYDPTNIFARILRGEIPNRTVLDTAHTLAFRDIAPKAPDHVLVIPKKHVDNILAFDEEYNKNFADFFLVIKKIAEAEGLKENGFRNQIQRKGHRNKPLSECQQRRNKRIARTRARVEHVFGAIEQMGGKLLHTIGQARANFAMTMMAACYNLKRLVYFQKAGIEAF